MSPLDDELRALLHARADQVLPAPDPLGGLESRARGLRRRRALVSASAAAVVVAAVAVAVPLATSGGGQPGRGFATAPPSASPSAPAASSYALDPAHPWAFRGDTDALGGGVQASFQRTWQAAHPGSTLTPLWAEVYEPSNQPEGLFVARGDGTDRLGFLQGSAAGPQVLWQRTVEQPLLSVPVELPGDEVGRLLVVAAPTVGQVDYAPDGKEFSQLAELAPGVAVGPREGTAQAAYRVLAADGTVVDSGPVHAQSPVPAGDPANVLVTWVHRGSRQVLSSDAVVSAYAKARGLAGPGTYRSLYDDSELGTSFTLGQVWLAGEAAAHTVALTSDGKLFLGPATPENPWVLGALLPHGSFAMGGKDALVLLPRPGAGRVGYSPDGTAPFTDVASGRSDLLAAGFVARDPGAGADRVQVHRGDDSVILTERVSALLD